MLLLTQGINLLAVDNGVIVKKKREETSFLLISFFEKERREHFDGYIIFFIEIKHEKFPAVWTAAKHVSFVTKCAAYHQVFGTASLSKLRMSKSKLNNCPIHDLKKHVLSSRAIVTKKGFDRKICFFSCNHLS